MKEMLCEKDAKVVEGMCACGMSLDALYRLIELPVRERRLLSYHFGLGTLECRTIGETAAYFHLTEKYISIIEKGALAKLREGMNDYKIV